MGEVAQESVGEKNVRIPVRQPGDPSSSASEFGSILSALLDNGCRHFRVAAAEVGVIDLKMRFIVEVERGGEINRVVAEVPEEEFYTDPLTLVTDLTKTLLEAMEDK